MARRRRRRGWSWAADPLDTRLQRAWMACVRSLNVILMLLGAFAVLLLGVVPTTARTTEAQPCHQSSTHAPVEDQAPAPSSKAMACCVSCVVAPALQPAARVLAVAPARPAPPVPASLPIGLSPAPEHGPPRA
jgi:hypothetical protein